ncbi:cytochrome c-type biogenesis protein CcmH [Wenzhouxiangella sp. XN79A]|uniref:cytochrome c-type biogenesis protein n=1 Tax=Wenzhouxiangella sp. XN79A TaxID=2724193 RepID=UPI00144ADF18|nr:cytochrome c-type biogenesis protein [Wenzhouxiangella sp. XN79A]NKI35759.1 cytochrome c-type biogenesis protein CcmH [Wenzhouxiangella sp. XN79A]
MTVRTLAATLLIVMATAVSAQSMPEGQNTNPIQPLDFTSETERERYHSLIGELRCTVCQNQALSSSDVPLAADLRNTVYRLIRDGRTDFEIRQFMRERYGDFVLYDPPLAGHTLLLWAGPPLLLIIGAVLSVVIVRNQRRRMAERAPAEPPAES